MTPEAAIAQLKSRALPGRDADMAADHKIARRYLGWAASYVDDRDWFIQKAVAWWLSDLSKHDALRTRQFLNEYDARMKPFTRREASKYLIQL